MKKTFHSLIIFAGLTSFNAQAITYTITDLGTLGKSYSVGHGINSHGRVTGHSSTIDNEVRTFLQDDSTIRTLGVTQNGKSSDILVNPGINESNQIAGKSITKGSPANPTFFYESKTTHATGSPSVVALVEPATINNNEPLAARSRLRLSSGEGAFIVDNHAQQIQQLLSILGKIASENDGINNNRLITDLGRIIRNALPLTSFIDDSNEIIREIATFTDLDGTGSNDINTHEQVNNISSIVEIDRNAFLHDDNTVRNLDALNSSSNSDDLDSHSDSSDINADEQEQIAEAGLLDSDDIAETDNSGGTESDLLITASATDVPAPATLLLSITGLIGVIGVHRRRRSK